VHDVGELDGLFGDGDTDLFLSFTYKGLDDRLACFQVTRRKMVGTILEARVPATAEEHLAVTVEQEQMYVTSELVTAGV